MKKKQKLKTTSLQILKMIYPYVSNEMATDEHKKWKKNYIDWIIKMDVSAVDVKKEKT